MNSSSSSSKPSTRITPALLLHRHFYPAAAAVVASAFLVATHLARTASTTTPSSSMTKVATAEAYSVPSIASARRQRLIYASDDVLFAHIESLQGNKPFGSFLDAGTGIHSLRWIGTLARDTHGEDAPKKGSSTTMTDFTAVTADETMRRNCQKEVDELGMSHLGKVVIGNWFPPNGDDDKQSLKRIDTDENGKRKYYDTILADYLIGAMDGFSPFTQDQMIDKLARRLKPGGRLYVVGLQPIPDSVADPNDPANIICEIRRVRDACILMAGDRCYREYPLDWIERQITKRTVSSARDHVPLELVDSHKFPILYRHTTIVKQINVARNKLPRFPTRALAKEMRQVLDDLEKRSYEATEKIDGKRIQLGFDYVVTAERTK